MAGVRPRDEDLDSEFDYAPEKRRKTWRDDPIATQKPSHVMHVPSHSAALPSKELLTRERDKEEWRSRRFHLLAMDAYSRHKALINQYLLATGRGIEHVQRSTENDRNDYTVLREQHKFLWEPDDKVDSWEEKLAKTYYDRLFKEYAIADLSRYKENKIALRWRIEKEVVEGKGQFACGNKHCQDHENLESWEVNFAYVEQGERKNALVKLRLCPSCSLKLNYHHKRKLWKSEKKSKKAKKPSKSSKKHKRHSKEKHRHGHKYKRRTSGEGTSKRVSTSDESSDSSDSDDGESAVGEKGDGGGSEAKSSTGQSQETSANSGAVWSKPAEAFLEKSKEEEFDDYFKDMLL
jgi:protein FRA10AC1